MLKISGLLAAGTLLLGIVSVTASVPTNAGSQAVSSPIVNLAQYDGGRCFNSCIRGRSFRRCQNDAQAKRESCCSTVCSRFYNWSY